MRGTAARLLLAVMLGAPAVAGAAMCIVDDMRVTVGSVDLFGRVVVPDLKLPVTIDEATGAFSLDLSSFPDTHFTIVGVDSDVHFPAAGLFAGTIDAAGNVTVPNVEMDLMTVVSTDPLTVTPTLTTGLHAVTISGKDYPTEGSRFDFSTATLTLKGEGVVENAPNAGGNISAGLLIQCHLDPADPMPDPTKLPNEPSLGHTTGDGKLATDSDSLTLRTILTQGAQTLDATNQDVFVRLRDASGVAAAFFRVPAGALVAKGKALKISDTDGTKIHVIAGHKVGATLAGSLTLETTKTGLKVTVDESGLDLSPLTVGAATVTVGIGTVTASDTVTVTKKGSKVILK